jgi:hypothetical protein
MPAPVASARVEVPQPPTREPVTIGCRLPMGLHLSVFTMVEAWEPVMGGGTRKTERASFVGRITVQGTGARMADDPRLLRGFALTHGVDGKLWAAWLEQNPNSKLVTEGMVFAHKSGADVRADARNGDSIRTGLEPLDPDSLPAEFRSRDGKNLIERATRAEE